MEVLSKARIKFIQALQHKKYRLKYDKFIVEGLKITRELLHERNQLVEEIYLSDPEHLNTLNPHIVDQTVEIIAPQYMHQLSQMATPPGVLAVCRLPGETHLPEDLSGLKMFYLDAIRDPGNLGTILRIADWFGLDYVIMSPDCVDLLNHKVLQASMGSALRVKCVELDKNDLLTLQGTKLYICDTEGKSIDTISAPGEGILVLGNESLGVSSDIMHQVQDVFAISSSRSLGAESLNVASAAAIIAHWWISKI
jgi:TrmH family RNA methyltransferase